MRTTPGPPRLAGAGVAPGGLVGGRAPARGVLAQMSARGRRPAVRLAQKSPRKQAAPRKRAAKKGKGKGADKPPPLRPGQKALREIRKYQRSTDTLIPWVAPRLFSGRDLRGPGREWVGLIPALS